MNDSQEKSMTTKAIIYEYAKHHHKKHTTQHDNTKSSVRADI